MKPKQNKTRVTDRGLANCTINKNNGGVKEIEISFLNEKIKRAQVRGLREIYTGHLLFYGDVALSSHGLSEKK